MNCKHCGLELDNENRCQCCNSCCVGCCDCETEADCECGGGECNCCED